MDPNPLQFLSEPAETDCNVLSGAANNAVVKSRREELLDAANRGYAALRENPEEWAAELAERHLWEVADLDGLEEA